MDLELNNVATQIKTIYGIRKLNEVNGAEKSAVTEIFPCNKLWLISSCDNAVLYVAYNIMGSSTTFLVFERVEHKNCITSDFSLARSQYNAWRQSYVSRHKVRNRAKNNIKNLTTADRLNDFLFCLKHECNSAEVIAEVERVIDLYISGLSDYNYISHSEIVAKGFGSTANLAEVSGLRYTQVANCIQRKKISTNLMPVLYPLLHEMPHRLDEEKQD